MRTTGQSGGKIQVILHYHNLAETLLSYEACIGGEGHASVCSLQTCYIWFRPFNCLHVYAQHVIGVTVTLSHEADRVNISPFCTSRSSTSSNSFSWTAGGKSSMSETKKKTRELGGESKEQDVGRNMYRTGTRCST